MSEERRQPSGLLQHGGGEWRFVTEVRRRATKGFEVRHIPGKGQGVFAMRDFAIGEDLLTELPLLSWPNDITMTDKNIESVVEAEFVRAGPRTRAMYESLSQASMHGGTKTAFGIWMTNALPSIEGGGHSVYSDACRLNHSCLPNVHHSFRKPSRAQHLRTIAKIRRGDELLLCYIDADEMKRSQRQAMLRRKFGFACECKICSLDGSERERSDARRDRMLALRTHRDAGECKSVAETVGTVEERLKLLGREGLSFVHGHADMMVAMEACRSGGDMRAASRWALRAAECVRVGAGEDSTIHQQLKQLASLLMVNTGIDASRYEF